MDTQQELVDALTKLRQATESLCSRLSTDEEDYVDSHAYNMVMQAVGRCMVEATKSREVIDRQQFTITED